MQFYANRQKKKKYNPASSLGMSPLGVIGWTVLMVSWSFVRPVTVDPLVRVRNGLMRGTKMTSEAGRDFLAFRAVPYAQPPVGSLRFQVRSSTRRPPPLDILCCGCFGHSAFCAVLWSMSNLYDRLI